jgi:hypothetical protein
MMLLTLLSKRNVLQISTIIVVAANSIQVGAQSAAAASQSPSMGVSIALQRDQISIGQTPRVILTIKNLADHEICLSTSAHHYRIHVNGTGSEPPKTEMHRHREGDFRPGDKPDVMEGPVVCPEIAPSKSDTRIYDLQKFYDLSTPGKYTVYVEVRDESGVWLRSNTVRFEMTAPAQ